MSVVFDGNTANYLSVTSQLLTDPLSGFSVGVWCKPSVAAVNRGIFQYFSDGTTADSNPSVYSEIRANNRVYTTIDTSAIYSRHEAYSTTDEWIFFGISRPSGNGGLSGAVYFFKSAAHTPCY